MIGNSGSRIITNEIWGNHLTGQMSTTRQEQHLARENKAAKVKKKQREERMWLKKMVVAAVRRVRLEGGDEETEEVQVKEMDGVEAREGQGPLREGQGVILC